MSYDSRVPDSPDPIADLREFGAVVFLGRTLTPYERVIVRSGLSSGAEFPRVTRSLPVRWRPLGPDDPPSKFGIIEEQEQ